MEMEEAQIYHSCLFCYRVFKVNPTVKVDSAQRQFLQILERFLEYDTASLGSWIDEVGAAIIKSNESVGTVISPCEDCSGIINSFCKYYEKIKVLQIKVEWILRTLIDIVRSSEKVKIRRRLFRKELKKSNMTDVESQENDISDLMKSVKCFRKELVEKCTEKFRDSYPKVKLRRLDCPLEKTLRAAPKRPHHDGAIQEDRNTKAPKLVTPSSRSDNKSTLFSEILNEPDLKFEHFEPPIELTQEGMEKIGNDTVEEFQLMSESATNSTLESPMDSMTAHEGDDCVGDFDTISIATAIRHGVSHEESECRYDNDYGDHSFPCSPAGTNQTADALEETTGKINNTTHDQIIPEAPVSLAFDDVDVVEPSRSAVQVNPSTDHFSLELIKVLAESVPKEVSHSCEVSLTDNIETSSLPHAVIALEENANQEEIQIQAVSKKLPSAAKGLGKVKAFPKEEKVISSRRVSLRQRHQCVICSKNFISSQNLEEHKETCVKIAEISDGEGESEEKDAESESNRSEVADFSSEREEEAEDVSDAAATSDEDEEDNKIKSEDADAVMDDGKKNKLKSRENNHPDSEFAKFACTVPGCGQRYVKNESLKQHLSRAHHSCTFCEKLFVRKYGLVNHQNEVHFKIQLEQVDNINTESRLHETGEILKCLVSPCPETFKNQQNLKTHSLLHGEFKCMFCEETKSYAPDLAVHEARSHGKTKTGKKARPYKTEKTQTFSCSRCDFPEYRERTYVQHFLQTHLNLQMVMRHTCSICKIVLSSEIHPSRNKFIQHYKRHHDLGESNSDSAPVYRCDSNDCDAYFLKEDQLQFHKFLIHNERRKFMCKICNKFFTSRFNRRKHGMRVHKLEYHIPCRHPGCRLRFPDEESLEKHVTFWHSQVPSISCSQCKRTFKSEQNLANHIRKVHAPNKTRKPPVEKKTYVCSECGKSFKDTGRLDLHILGLHTDPKEWKFSCDVCDKKCLSSWKLEEHKRTHTQEKPFTCEHCGLSYAHRHNFRHHLTNKHGIIFQDPRRMI